MLENPITGERLLFRKTSSDTGGEAVVLETFVKANRFLAAAHARLAYGLCPLDRVARQTASSRG
jgi:hypothetical protein